MKLKFSIKYLLLIVPALLTILLTGCQKEDINSQEQTNRFVGKWLVEEYTYDLNMVIYDTLGIEIISEGVYRMNEGPRPISFALHNNYTGISLDSVYHTNGSAGITTTTFKWIDAEDKLVLLRKETNGDEESDTLNIIAFERNSTKLELNYRRDILLPIRDSIFDDVVTDSLIEIKEYNYTVVQTLSETFNLKRE